MANVMSITLTCGEQSENHAGMRKQGAGLAKEGLTELELQHARKRLLEHGCERVEGTVYGFAEVPLTAVYRAGLEVIFGEKLIGCQMEGNRYDNVGKQGIGVHGDQERKIVVG
eukprot:gene33147-42398_t